VFRFVANLNKTGRTDQEPADPDLLAKLVSDIRLR
jgi:hypothetical protein